jgi:hypothetical protein
MPRTIPEPTSIGKILLRHYTRKSPQQRQRCPPRVGHYRRRD